MTGGAERPRPDPDALLRRVQAEEGAAKRGRLTIFFGFAPGVGKTWRMLTTARERARRPGEDVVIGVVEHHGREDTRALITGLTQLPLRPLSHRGKLLEELDLEGLLARRPSLALIDELAHTNAPGSRHATRWQDVEAVRDAGIDVYTTLNVQHVEGLNDAVARITRVTVRETVPDAVIDGADTIEVVDLPPPTLLERLRQGKVYVPAQAERARQHFFQEGNLHALRELALRRAARRVDDDLRAYRADHGVAATLPATPRLLVCLSAAPASGRLVQATAGLAAELRCPWLAVTVDDPRRPPPAPATQARLEAHLRQAEGLGGEVLRLQSTDPAQAIITAARSRNVTRVLVGKPTRARLLDRLRGSFLDALVRASGDIDVHVLTGATEADGGGSAQAAPIAAAEPTGPAPWGLAVGAVAFAAGAAAAVRETLDLPDLELLFLPPVVLAAARGGRGPALLAAALSVAVYDFFFVPPFYTFSVRDPRSILTFATMFAVALGVSELTTRLRQQERASAARERRTQALYALSRALSGSGTAEALAAVAVARCAELVPGRAWLLRTGGDGVLHVIAAEPPGRLLEPKDEAVARWAVDHQRPAGRGTADLPGAEVLALPLGEARAALVVAPAGPGALDIEQRGLLELAARQVAAALLRIALAEQARAAEDKARTEELRSSVLSAVSHDLRTPLASITGAATTLRDLPPYDPVARGELLDGICDEAARLERLLCNLLELSRLEAGALRLRRDWVPADELIGSALARLDGPLGARPVRVEVSADCPLLHVDPVVTEQIFVNLLENAVRYTPACAPITLRAHGEGPWVEISVIDAGPGLPPGPPERLFTRFTQGESGAPGGAGLGLAVCKGIAEAHGGSIQAESLPEGGACFRVRLPGGVPAAPAAASVGDPPPEDDDGR
jgi:two-component system sensor histidine kinase KdpD